VTLSNVTFQNQATCRQTFHAHGHIRRTSNPSLIHVYPTSPSKLNKIRGKIIKIKNFDVLEIFNSLTNNKNGYLREKDLNEFMQNSDEKNEITFWDIENLVDFFTNDNLGRIYFSE